MEIEVALGDYLLQITADGRSPHTINQYRRHISLFASWLGERELEEVGHRDIARFLTSDVVQLRADGRPRKATSSNTIRSSLRTFFSFLHAAGFVDSNAARLVRRARCSPGPPRALSEGEQARLLAALDTAQTAAERRDAVLFRLLLATGARLGAVLAAEVEDLAASEGELRLRRQKRGGEGVVYIPRDVVEVLVEHLGGRREGWLFRGGGVAALGHRQVARRLAMWLDRARVERRASPHSLRHSFATNLYNATRDIALVGAALGHASISSTSVYARARPHEVRRAVDGITS